MAEQLREQQARDLKDYFEGAYDRLKGRPDAY